MGSCHSTRNITDEAISKGALPAGASVVFVLGGPGSGKGTQCEKIAEKYDCAHISAGDLLREEVKSGSELGKECEALMKEGKLVPIETTLSLLQSAMLKSTKKTFLIDGFPRAIEQAMRFDAEIQPCTAVLYFECSEEVMTARLLERGRTSGRSDDNVETIQKRLKTFQEMSEPVAKFYETQGKCFRLSGEDAPEVVFEKVQNALDSYLKQKKASAVSSKTAHIASEVETIEDQKTASGAKSEPPPPAASAAETATQPPAEAAEPPQDCAGVESLGRVVFVLGGPGSGKGTQCERIVSDYGFRHISVGDLLRAEVESGSDLGTECDTLMKEGKLVPIETTLELLKKAIEEGSAEFYLIDGFPRSIEQAELFERQVASCDCVLYLECSESVMLERMTERAKRSGRADDNPETMQKRLATFSELSAPVARFYTEMGKCHTISAERYPSEIYADVQTILNELKPSTPDQSEDEETEAAEKQTEGKENTILILQGKESKTAEALSVAIEAKGWKCICQVFEEGSDLSSVEAKAILWHLSPSEDDSVAALQDQLRQAVEKGIAICPSLEVFSAGDDEAFRKKITEKESNEDAQTVTVRFSNETPLDIVVSLAKEEKSEDGEVQLKPDDPEIAPLIQQLLSEDLGKIKAATSEVLSPLWSAVYDVVQSQEEAKEYVFKSLRCLPLDLIGLEHLDTLAQGVVTTLCTES